jgi:hypothetical protein
MALYDDLDAKQGSDKIGGWSSGIKLLQTQLAVKKASNVAQLHQSSIRNIVRKNTVIYGFWFHLLHNFLHTFPSQRSDIGTGYKSQLKKRFR